MLDVNRPLQLEDGTPVKLIHTNYSTQGCLLVELPDGVCHSFRPDGRPFSQGSSSPRLRNVPRKLPVPEVAKTYWRYDGVECEVLVTDLNHPKPIVVLAKGQKDLVYQIALADFQNVMSDEPPAREREPELIGYRAYKVHSGPILNFSQQYGFFDLARDEADAYGGQVMKFTRDPVTNKITGETI